MKWLFNDRSGREKSPQGVGLFVGGWPDFNAGRHFSQAPLSPVLPLSLVTALVPPLVAVAVPVGFIGHRHALRLINRQWARLRRRQQKRVPSYLGTLSRMVTEPYFPAATGGFTAVPLLALTCFTFLTAWAFFTAGFAVVPPSATEGAVAVGVLGATLGADGAWANETAATLERTAAATRVLKFNMFCTHSITTVA